MTLLFESYKHEIIAHAEDAFPHECCGVIWDGKYIRCENVDDDPENHFSFSTEDEFKYIADKNTAPLTEAIVHSHPIGPNSPSASDMKAQIATDLPFIIVAHDTFGWTYIEFGDHRLDDPLMERPFEHGVLDCGSAIRSWYWQKKGIKLKDFARDDEWWYPEEDEDGNIIAPAQNIYLESYKAAGFEEVHIETMHDLKEGDVFFYKLASSGVECHAGVYTGGDMIYHHLPKRLSREELLGPWFNKMSRWVRYKGLEDA